MAAHKFTFLFELSANPKQVFLSPPSSDEIPISTCGLLREERDKTSVTDSRYVPDANRTAGENPVTWANFDGRTIEGLVRVVDRVLDPICQECGQDEGEHSAFGNFCPNNISEGPGEPLFLKTKFSSRPRYCEASVADSQDGTWAHPCGRRLKPGVAWCEEHEVTE